MDDFVTVYGFRVFDRHIESPSIASFKARRDVLQALGADILEGTGEDVPLWALDEEGCYRRQATGWVISTEHGTRGPRCMSDERGR